ncbi:lipoate-protein ligase A related protein [Planctomycetaceae bacterium SCGC AG-212-D15]|nr:lipoate-protein ligase A related protein [Planctomycetaceae bacterium SCGC AG-212-D15]
MHLLHLTLPTPEENLALDEALLLAAEDGVGGEVLRLWEHPHYTVILGAGGRLADDVDEAACESDGVPILRRASGGGTVLLGPGCLLFTLVLAYQRDPALRDIHASYRFILERLAKALDRLLPGTAPAGISDLAVEQMKFSGNAQQRKRDFLLHHGTILYDFDLSRVGRYLRQPARQPEYRRNRPHADFVRNLATDRAAIEHAVAETWDAHAPLPTWPAERVAQLVAEKYSLQEWVRRR